MIPGLNDSSVYTTRAPREIYRPSAPQLRLQGSDAMYARTCAVLALHARSSAAFAS